LEVKVKDIGMKEVYCADPSMNLSEIASMMKRYNVGVIPVCEGRKLLYS
jgi:CBS domain-containing protein